MLLQPDFCFNFLLLIIICSSKIGHRIYIISILFYSVKKIICMVVPSPRLLGKSILPFKCHYLMLRRYANFRILYRNHNEFSLSVYRNFIFSSFVNERLLSSSRFFLSIAVDICLLRIIYAHDSPVKPDCHIRNTYFCAFGTSFIEKLILPILSFPRQTTVTLSPNVSTSSTRLILSFEILEI